ncbi:uncharacterized protein LOC125494983 [Beta vulgaris subsp. vulgaris]|uniref:uncharacterized protein LOC125494983 n=1 Tax=Beta vulgaris subsp. vulgaris TaxID=3555 RepID=UPI002036DFE1|nr:uncharacterized protein LOC125494983 [Beta vulgaris subsp. vulgaris]
MRKEKPTMAPFSNKPDPRKIVPFPSRFANSRKEELDNDILRTFRKVEINIPLLDAIKQMPKYAKFLKDLWTNKRKIQSGEKVCVGENVSAVIQKKIPPKCKDPGMFSIPCKIGNYELKRCMLDLGASISVMPKSIYKSLNLGPLSKTNVVIQLADRSQAYPLGVLEDVLVQVNELVFPVDFYIFDMGDTLESIDVPLLLGRPFLKIAKAKIDVSEGTISFEFDGEMIKLNIYDAMRYPSNILDVNFVDCIDEVDCIKQENFNRVYELCDNSFDKNLTELNMDDYLLDATIINSFHVESFVESPLTAHLENHVAAQIDFGSGSINYESANTCANNMQSVSSCELPVNTQKLIPSIQSPPKLELKSLPNNLKYAYLGENDTLPIIISSSLSESQEEKLLNVLKEYKEAIRWTIADIKGISPTLCMHKIYLENDAKPVREAQRRLNPSMMDVVKKEILKWRDAGVIFPISDSKWVSSIHVVPKKTGITVVENNKGELVPTRVSNGWRVCRL